MKIKGDFFENPSILEFINAIPEMLEEKKVFILLIDGLGTRTLKVPIKFTKKVFKTVFPSSTPTFLYSLHSLLPPEKHGYLEWYMRFKNLKEPITVPPWKTVSGKELRLGKEVKKRDVFPFRSLSEIVSKSGKSTCYYTPYIGTFTKAVSRKAKVRRIRYFSEIFPLEDCDLSLAYWPSADTILHEKFDGETFDSELKVLGFYVKLLWKKLPKNSRLIVTSDHGLVKVKRRYLLPVINGKYPVGGMRVAFYKGLEIEEVKNAIKEKRIPAEVSLIEEMFETKNVSKRCYENFGNVVVIAKDKFGFRYPFEKGKEVAKGGHGGKGKKEMLINVWNAEK